MFHFVLDYDCVWDIVNFAILYETNHLAYGPVINCNSKQGHYSDRTICEMIILNEIHHNFATSTYLQVVCLVLKSPHTQNMLLRIESTGRYTHVP